MLMNRLKIMLACMWECVKASKEFWEISERMSKEMPKFATGGLVHPDKKRGVPDLKVFREPPEYPKMPTTKMKLIKDGVDITDEYADVCIEYTYDQSIPYGGTGSDRVINICLKTKG